MAGAFTYIKAFLEKFQPVLEMLREHPKISLSILLPAILAALLWLFHTDCHLPDWFYEYQEYLERPPVLSCPDALKTRVTILEEEVIPELKKELAETKAKEASLNQELNQNIVQLKQEVQYLGEIIKGPVIEEELRKYITNNMNCGADQFYHSKLIRFDTGEETVWSEERRKIRQFARQCLPEARKITVFGFTSPDGSAFENKKLASRRAEEVGRLLAKYAEKDPADINLDVWGIGEWHPINGIANSRSAVIAVCRSDKQSGALEQCNSPLSD